MSNKDGALDRKFVVPVRTDLQISPWEGPEGIRAASRHAVTDGSRTILFANPPVWTESAGCIDDWKAFDDGGVSSGVAKALCSGCPVIGECLSDAMAQEGTQLPAFRSGVRGGLNTKERFALAVGDRECPEGHPFKKFGVFHATGEATCGECAREARVPKRTSTRKRDRSLWECGNCGRTLLTRNKNPHKRSKACLEFGER